MELNFKRIGRRIRQERTKAGLSQAKLAELAASSPQYISHIETARKNASLKVLVNIANALNISVDQLLADYQSKTDAELFLIVSGCSDYEKRVITDIALATKNSLKENEWRNHTDKS